MKLVDLADAAKDNALFVESRRQTSEDVDSVKAEESPVDDAKETEWRSEWSSSHRSEESYEENSDLGSEERFEVLTQSMSPREKA